MNLRGDSKIPSPGSSFGFKRLAKLASDDKWLSRGTDFLSYPSHIMYLILFLAHLSNPFFSNKLPDEMGHSMMMSL